MPTDRKRSLWGDVVPFLLNHREILGRWGGWMTLIGFLVLAWLANSSTAFVQHLADPLWQWAGWQPAAGLARAAAELLVPAVLFFGAVVALRVALHRHQNIPDAVSPQTIQPHKGLIASISVFHIPLASGEETRAVRHEIEAAVVKAPGSGANPRKRLLEMLYRSNWGPFAAAVELHAERLTRVWLLCTPAVKNDFKLARDCIRFLTANRAEVEPIPIADQNDLQEVRLRMLAFYELELKRAGLREDQVIADITGGSKAMTADIVLATLDEQRHVQYLSQGGPRSLLEDGHPRHDLSQVFRYVDTSPSDVSRAFISYMESRAGGRERT